MVDTLFLSPTSSPCCNFDSKVGSPEPLPKLPDPQLKQPQSHTQSKQKMGWIAAPKSKIKINKLYNN